MRSADLIGRTLAHYQITAAIGAGGMGDVFRATDTRLSRDVALKVLPPEFARDPERLARFTREARAIAALNHPHIVTIYSVDEIDGVHFLTMELIEGESLAQLIPDGGLAVDRTLAIGTAMADALAAAHDKGIVHRDLKPANVMMTNDGRVKVLDFGLAKELRPTDPADATLTIAGRIEIGVVMGTPAYMSPEQVAGRPMDHRTDIFSLGILLYQMASGQRPFEGSTSIELASSILRDVPRPITEIRSDVPADLGRLIRRCLEKDVQRRVQTAHDVANELRDIARPSQDLSRRSAAGAQDLSRRSSEAAKADEGFWVAVLPFKYSGGNPDVGALAEGLSEEIVTGLSRFSYLKVIARAADQKVTARYVIDGSLRQAGSQLRLAVQLVDATTGAHLWAETYDRPFQPDQIFALQDDLIPRIVSTCADMVGVLARSISEAVRSRDASRLTPYEALMRSFGYHHRLTPAEHAEARAALERAVEQAPANPDCWAMLSWMYSDEFGHGFNVRPRSLDRALTAARRAVDIAPSNHLAHQALARAHFFRKEMAACRNACDRALALNPLDGSNEAIFLLCFTGDWDRGCALVRRSMELNPHYPGWYRWMLAIDEYRKGNYRAAVDEGVKANVPEIFWTHVLFAAAYGQLGEHDAARAALGDAFAQKGDFAGSARESIGKWFDPALGEHLIDGLRKAGLDTPAGPSSSTTPAAKSGAHATSSTPSIAVLPFANLSADKDQEYFSDGLAEEIINLLAQMSGLKVIARTSAFAFRGRDEDVRKIAQALDVTHVLQGSVRRAGDRVRVAAQLIAAADGGHVWSDRYDRELRDIFALQDEISASITAALRVKLSGEAQPQRYQPKLPPYEAYLKARSHQAKVTPESMEEERRCYELAVELDPGFGLAHVGLGSHLFGQTVFGRVPAHEAVPAARAAIQRALQTDPSLPEAHALLGYLAAFYDLDWAAADRHFEVPRARQAGWPLIRPMYGGFLFLKGEIDEAIAIAERAIQEDPLEVWPRMNLHAFLQAAGRDREAYEQTLKVLELDGNLVVARVSVAHFHAHWGQLIEAVAAARQAHAVGPWYADATATLAALLRRTGEEGEAHTLYESLGASERFGDARAQAVYHLLCGDVDTAADWVEKAIEQRDQSMMFYLRFVISRPLRASHRWMKIARMINLPA